MRLPAGLGAINSFISRAGARLPQFALNPLMSRFVPVYSKMIVAERFYQLINGVRKSYKICSSEIGSRSEKLDELKGLVLETSYSIVLLAALHFNPYIGRLVVLGRGVTSSFQCIKNNYNISLKNSVGCCFLIKDMAGIICIFRPNATWLTIRVAARILGRCLIIYSQLKKEKFEFFSRDSKKMNTMKNWCFEIVFPVVVDSICVNAEIKILLINRL